MMKICDDKHAKNIMHICKNIKKVQICMENFHTVRTDFHKGIALKTKWFRFVQSMLRDSACIQVFVEYVTITASSIMIYKAAASNKWEMLRCT